jgi:hypothetical protein
MAIVNALLYIARTGCQWRMLPRDFPLSRRCSVASVLGAMTLQAREAAGRESSQPAGVIDSQSVRKRRAARGGVGPRSRQSRDPGDADREVKGRKRHIVTDTTGRLVGAEVHAADIQDRDVGAGNRNDP